MKLTRTVRGSLFFTVILLLDIPAFAAESSIDTEAANAVRSAAVNNRFELKFDGAVFSGPGYQTLLAEGTSADFFMVGEEHGIAENPMLLGQLFADLSPVGYRRLVIEVSPPMAAILDQVLASGGLEGLREFYASPGHTPAFFGMREEVEMLATVRAAVGPDEPAFWGVDYEVAGDLALLGQLSSLPKPPAAAAAVKALEAASEAAWAQLASTGNPGLLLTFSADPQRVRDIEMLWPDRGARAQGVLDALEETLEINRLWTSGNRYESNARRAGNLRKNFLSHWSGLSPSGELPRIMLKLGANHLVRGRNMTQTFDLGSLVPELAASTQGRSFSVLVVPGAGASTAVLDPSTWSHKPAAPKDGYLDGLGPLVAAAAKDTFTLIDLRPLRSISSRYAKQLAPELMRAVFGFDMLLVMSGSTASENF